MPTPFYSSYSFYLGAYSASYPFKAIDWHKIVIHSFHSFCRVAFVLSRLSLTEVPRYSLARQKSSTDSWHRGKSAVCGKKFFTCLVTSGTLECGNQWPPFDWPTSAGQTMPQRNSSRLPAARRYMRGMALPVGHGSWECSVFLCFIVPCGAPLAGERSSPPAVSTATFSLGTELPGGESLQLLLRHEPKLDLHLQMHMDPPGTIACGKRTCTMRLLSTWTYVPPWRPSGKHVSALSVRVLPGRGGCHHPEGRWVERDRVPCQRIGSGSYASPGFSCGWGFEPVLPSWAGGSSWS